MDTRGNDRLREMLAAEYALGTLRGGARRRFERWARNDGELRALAFAWSERLVPLLDSVPPAVPPQRVWDAIEALLPGFGARHGLGHGPRAAAPLSWWDRVGLWRGLSAAFAAAAVFAIAVAMRPSAVPEPRVVRVETAPSAVATLLDPKSGAPVAVVLANDRGDAVTIKVAAGVRVPAGKVLQLWIQARDTQAMESMGLLSAGVVDVTSPVPTVDAAVLARAKAFGLSLEPAGGSPAPTEVVGLGALVRLSG